MCSKCCVNCTHDEYGNKAGGYDDPVTLTVMSSFSNKDTVEYEVSKSQLEPTSCRHTHHNIIAQHVVHIKQPILVEWALGGIRSVHV